MKNNICTFVAIIIFVLQGCATVELDYNPEVVPVSTKTTKLSLEQVSLRSMRLPELAIGPGVFVQFNNPRPDRYTELQLKAFGFMGSRRLESLIGYSELYSELIFEITGIKPEESITKEVGSFSVYSDTSPFILKDLQQALEKAIRKSRFFGGGGGRGVLVKAILFEADAPTIAGTMVVRVGISYQVVYKDTNKVLFEVYISNLGQAKISEVIEGDNRRSLAKNRAVQRNIEEFITHLIKQDIE